MIIVLMFCSCLSGRHLYQYMCLNMHFAIEAIEDKKKLYSDKPLPTTSK